MTGLRHNAPPRADVAEVCVPLPECCLQETMLRGLRDAGLHLVSGHKDAADTLHIFVSLDEDEAQKAAASAAAEEHQ